VIIEIAIQQITGAMGVKLVAVWMRRIMPITGPVIREFVINRNHFVSKSLHISDPNGEKWRR